MPGLRWLILAIPAEHVAVPRATRGRLLLLHVKEHHLIRACLAMVHLVKHAESCGLVAIRPPGIRGAVERVVVGRPVGLIDAISSVPQCHRATLFGTAVH